MTAGNFPAPVLRSLDADDRLTHLEKSALVTLWIRPRIAVDPSAPAHDTVLSTREYLPLKMASFGTLIGIRREAAARVMRRLIACGYVQCVEPADRSQPREFLLVNVMRVAA